MDHPLSIPRYIQLSVDRPLETALLRDWLGCVRAAAPSGVVATVQTVDDAGQPQAVKLVHREAKGRHAYLVPLTRDLADAEVEQIVRAYADDHPDLDFDIETQADRLAVLRREPIDVDAAEHLALCLAIAKRRHGDWMRERSDAGWRYGPSFSAEEKVHPLIRPWEQLPDRYRTPDLNAPQALIDMLAQHGYAVVTRDDLERIKAGG